MKQRTSYEGRISGWSSEVCSSDLLKGGGQASCVGVHGLDELGGRLAVDQRVGVLQALVDARGHPQLQLRVERGVADLLARQVAYVAVLVEIGRAAWRESESQYV